MTKGSAIVLLAVAVVVFLVFGWKGFVALIAAIVVLEVVR